MKILAIETSCDETAIAALEKNQGEDYIRILTEVKASSVVSACAVHYRS